MNQVLFKLLITSVWLLVVVSPLGTFAQTPGPGIDPTFASPTQIFLQGYARQVIQQANGGRVVFGTFSQVAGVNVPNGLARLLPGSNQIDAVFQANTAGLITTGIVDAIVSLPGNKVLLYSTTNAPISLGSVSHPGLLRLNADGTPDANFNIGVAANSYINGLGVQPDGKILLSGYFTQFNGQPTNRLIRLNTDGTLDVAFQAAGSGPNGTVFRIVMQPGGKILLTGDFTSIHGQAVGMVARLLPNGTLDASFSTVPVPANLFSVDLATQSDGKILVNFFHGQGVVPTGWQPLMRLLPDGTLDPSFQTGTNFGSFYAPYSFGGSALTVQPDDRILVTSTYPDYNGQPIGPVVRLLTNGNLDPSFQTLQTTNPLEVGGYYAPRPPGTLQLLPNGQILLNYALLNADGTPDPGFAPALKNPGALYDVARQPDGRLLVGGYFSEIGGVAANGVARLSATGVPEAAFAANAATNFGGIVQRLGLQPDGKVVAAGNFTRLGGLVRAGLGRLNVDGTPDVGFAPALLTRGAQPPLVSALALQADGNVLVAGNFAPPPGAMANANQNNARLLGTTGQFDSGFQPLTNFDVYEWLVQPDNKPVAAGSGTAGMVRRVLLSGAADPAFVPTPLANSQDRGASLALDATGRLYVGGRFDQVGSVFTSDVARLLPNGAPDASFSASFAGQSAYVVTVAVQPNGRLLVGGTVPDAPGVYYGTARLLADGSRDGSYSPFLGPARYVGRLLVQPDGAIVAAGAFQAVAGQPLVGLVRLLDTHVLAVSTAQREMVTQVWPVPAHSQLHLALDAAAVPTRVELCDALGRAVRAQTVSAMALTLDIAGLPAGLYVLRVRYATGWVSQHVVVE